MNKVTSASLGYPLSVFNKNSALKPDSIENPRSFEKFPTPPQTWGGGRFFEGYQKVISKQDNLAKSRVQTLHFEQDPPTVYDMQQPNALDLLGIAAIQS